MQKLLTIVVPVYKVEAYIDKCLSSLVLEDASLMDRLEVIIVNDGTPDRSAEMSREYVKRYPGTFRQIDKENGGHGSAWNVGLKEATGKYLRFLDSDDWFTNLDRLLEDLSVRDVDILFHPYVKHFTETGQTVQVGTTIPSGKETGISKEMWGKSPDGYSCVNFWSSTYKTSILKPLLPLFAERVMFDDYILTWAPLVHGRTCLALDYPVYHYLIGRPGQSMSFAQQRKGAKSYLACFRQYEDVRSRIAVGHVPGNLLECMDGSIRNYAHFVFSFLPFLPYREARAAMEHLWDGYVRDIAGKTRLARRYGSLPFPVFYALECLRSRKNK